MSRCFPKPFRGEVNVKVDLSNYAIKAYKIDLKNATGVDTSKLAAKSHLASLKTEVDKIDVDKLSTVLVDLSYVINNDVVKKIVNDKLVAKLKNIDTSGFVLKAKYVADKSDLEKKVIDVDNKNPDTSELVKKADCSAKTTEIEGKIPSISGLATTSALTAVESKI